MLIDPHRYAARVITVSFSDTSKVTENATEPTPKSINILALMHRPIIARHFFGLEFNQKD